MDWHVELRVQANAVHAMVSLNEPGEVYDAVLRCGPGVRCTSFGGSSRRILTEYDKPLQGIYRWDSETADPYIRLTWRDSPEGSQQHEVIRLST